MKKDVNVGDVIKKITVVERVPGRSKNVVFLVFCDECKNTTNLRKDVVIYKRDQPDSNPTCGCVSNKKWTQHKHQKTLLRLIKDYQEVNQTTKAPTQSELQAFAKKQGVSEYFFRDKRVIDSTYNQFLVEHDFEVNKRHSETDAETVLQDLKEFEEKTGLELTIRNVDNCPWLPNHIAIKNLFGKESWDEVQILAGYEATYNQIEWTKTLVIEAVRNRFGERTPLAEDFWSGQPQHSKIIELFNSFDQFLMKAGYTLSPSWQDVYLKPQ